MRNEQYLGFLEHGDRLLASDRREVVEKIRERVPAFDVVDERLHRHTRPDEHRSATENLGVGGE